MSTERSTEDQNHSLSRRSFLRLAGGTAIAGTALPLILEACGGTAAPASSAAGSPPASAASKAASAPASASAAASAPARVENPLTTPINPKNAKALPNYFAPKLLAPPDFNANDPKVMVGYNHFPKTPVKSWTKEPPGDGSNVTAFVAAYYPPPTPYDQNPTWQAVNKALNANVQMNIVAGPDYLTKLATIMAGNDIPDIMHIFFGIGAAPNLPDFFKAKCADLTPYLAGDAIKDYPNLAAIPTYAWNNSVSAIDGTLYQWPIHRYLPGLSYLFKNTDMWDQKIGKGVAPKDAADLKKIMGELNDPKAGVWAVGNVSAAPFNFGINGYAQIFGAPNQWGFDASGKLVKDWETEEFKAAVGFARDLWSAGLIWPDAPSQRDSRTNFVAKKFALSIEGFGNSWNDFWLRGLTVSNPPAHFDIVMPFSADAKTKVQSFITGGYISTNVMKKGSPDRIKMLLRVLDYLAAPFGSQEQELLFYGLTPADYTIDSNGDPQLTKDGKNRSQYVPWQYISAPPYVEYYAGIPGYAEHVFPIEKALIDPKIAVADVTLGYYAPDAYGAPANQARQTLLDGVNDIIMSRRPLTDYDGLVKAWQNSIGNKMKGEYNTAMGKA